MRTSILMIPLAAGWLWAAAKGPPSGKAASDAVEIEATVHTGKEAVTAQIGEAPEGISVVQVRITPRGAKPLAVNRDEFTLRSDKDGQRSQPFAPSQIAGSATLVVATGGGGRGAFVGEDRGPVWGGAPGTGGRPRRLGSDGGAIGNTSEEQVQAAVDSGSREKENPLLATLKRKILPEKETSEPLAGLLYFSLEGKHKPKDLELIYKGPGGRLSIRFK